MDNIHLTTSFNFIQKQNFIYSQIVIDKFIESCLKLDASIFEPYMYEDDVFEDKEKYSFLAQLHSIFNEFIPETLENYKMSINDTVCKGCLKGTPVKHFKIINNVTKKSVNEFAFMIEVEQGILKDIYRCYDYKGCRTYTFGDNSKGYPEFEMSYDLFMKSRKKYFESKA